MKNELNEFYQKKTLSPKKIEELLTLQEKLKQRKRNKVKLPFMASLVAASIALIIFVQFNNKPLDQKIMAEVIYNHNKDMPPEVLTEDYELIDQALDKLDFKVIKSQRLASHYKLIGARYCSIQGKIAAQFKLIDTKTNTRITLYQFKPNFSPISSSSSINGSKVEIWHEGETSFAMARK